MIGVATTAGTYGFTLQVVSGNQTISIPVTMRVTSVDTVDRNNLPDAFGGTSYSYQFVATASSGTFTYSTTSTLPAGLTLGAGGLLSGTPTTPASYNFNITVTDGTDTVTRQYQLLVSTVQVLTAGQLPNATQGSAYTQIIAASGGTGALTLSLNGGSLPNGLSLTNGTISGTVTGGPGQYTFGIRAVDANNTAYTKNMALDVIGSPAAALPRITAGNYDDSTLGNFYSATFGVCCGGTAPFSWAVQGLPAGMKFRTGSGVTSSFISPGTVEIYGRPNAAGVFNLVLTLTDFNGATTSLTVPLNVSLLDQLNFLPNGVINQSYAGPYRVVGGAGTTYTATQVAGTLTAAGTALSGLTLAGTPVETGFFAPQVVFADTNSNTLKRSPGFSVNGAASGSTISINSGSSLGNFGFNAAYNQTLFASGAASIVWSFTGGTIPAGLGISSGGVLSGTLTTPGVYNFTLTASDAANTVAPGARQFTLNVTPITITTNGLTFANVGTAYSATLAASGGTGALNWAISAFQFLPPGISLSSAGVLGGNPTSPGQYFFDVTVTDANNARTNRGFTLNIFPAGQAPTLLISNNANLGTFPLGANELGLFASGGTGTYVWSVAGGSTLPAGVNLRTDIVNYIVGSPQAELAMLPQAPGSSTFTLNVTSGTQTASRAFTIKYTALQLKDTFLPDAFVGNAYSYQFTPVSNTGAVTFTADNPQNYPAGITVNSAGLLQGTPTTPGSYTIFMHIADSVDNVFVYAYQLNVYSINITTAGLLPNVNQTGTYSQTLAATGGAGGYAWTYSGGLPDNLVLLSGGQIKGTISSSQNPGRYGFQVTATDTNRVSYTKRFSIDVIGLPAALPRISVGQPDDLNLGNLYSYSLGVINGGTAPFSWSATGLPPNVSIRSGSGITSTYINPGDAEIYGIPQTAGVYNALITVTDATGLSTSLNVPLKIGVLAVRSQISNSGSMANGTINLPYTFQLRPIGGTAPYSIQQLVNSKLPTVLSVNNTTLVVSGIPTENVSLSPTFRYADSAGNTSNLTNSIAIGNATSTININGSGNNSYDLGGAAVNVSYSTSFFAGGANAFNWTLAGGTLPTGLTLSSGGVLNGTPTVAGNYTFLLAAADSSNAANTGFRQFLLSVTPISFTTSSLPNGNVGTPYNQAIVVAGASGTQNFSLYYGFFLPPGITMSAGGVLSGIPTSTGQYSFNVVSTDGSTSARRSYTLSIYAAGALPPVSLNLSNILGPTQFGRNFFSLQASGGTGTGYVYTYSPGATPIPGARVQTGQPLPTFLGTATAALMGVISPGTYNSSIRATDSAGNFFDRAFTYTVVPFTLLDQSPLPKGTINTAYNGTGYQLTAAGGTAAYSFTATNVPPGMTLSSTGLLSGTPSAAGTFNINVTLGNASVTATVGITEQVVINPFAITTGGTLPQATANLAYSTTLTAAGCGTSCAWSFLGSLPGGLSLNSSTGVISGTPNATVGTFASFTIQAAGSNGTVQKVFALVVAPTTSLGLQITTGSGSALTSGTLTIGTATSLGLFASGGTAPYSFIVQGGTLPPGMSLFPSGDAIGGNLIPGVPYIAGRPLQAGTSTFTLQVTDANSRTATRAYTWVVSPLSIEYTGFPLTSFGSTLIRGQAYSQPMLVVGGSGTYSYALAAPLPGLGATTPYPGLSLGTTTGITSGTPTDTGSLTQLWTVADSNGAAATAFVSFTSSSSATQTISLAGPGLGTVIQMGSNNPYNLSPSTFTAAVGATPGSTSTVGPYAITVIGTLPPGVLLLTGTGLSTSFNGTTYGLQISPVTPGTFTFTLQAADSNNVTGVRTYSFVVPPFTNFYTNSLVDASVNQPYAVPLYEFAITATAPTWALATGAVLPAGLTLSASGVLSGTPTVAGTYQFTINSGDPANPAQNTFALKVSPIAITNGGILPTANNGALYRGTGGYALLATGGTGALTWTIPANALPSGLSMSAAGVITGTPDGNSGGGRFATTVTVTDSAGNSIASRISIYLEQPNPGLLTFNIANAALTDGVLNQIYAVGINPDGGLPPYTATLAAGSTLPPGLGVYSGNSIPGNQFPGAIVILGAPTQAGQYSFSLNIRDSNSAQVTRTFTLNVTSLNLTTGNPPNMITNVPYQYQFNATGGTAPYTFTASLTGQVGDFLPTGVVLTSSGLLSGNPTSTGTYTFRVTVTDAAGLTLVRNFTVGSTNSKNVRLNNNSIATVVGNTAVFAALSVSDLRPTTYTWSLAPLSGPLPTGVTLVSTGSYTGTYAAAGTYQFTLRVTDNADATNVADRTLTYRVSPMQLVNPTFNLGGGNYLPPGAVTQPYSYTLRVAGGVPPYSYAESAFNPLPPGLTMSSSGILSGTPTQSGDFFPRPLVTDSTGASLVSNTLTLSIAPSGGTVPLNPRGAFLTALDGAVGIPYQPIRLERAMVGGTPPYSFALASGSALPPGLNLMNSSTLGVTYPAGIPTTSGIYTATLVATDSAAKTVPLNFTFNISPLSLTPAALPAGRVGTSYTVNFAASGGTAPYNLAATGAMAPGLSLSGAVLSGTPTNAGVFSVPFTLTDGGTNTYSRSFEIVVDNALGEAQGISLSPRPVNAVYIQGNPAPAAALQVSSTSGNLTFGGAMLGIAGAAFTPATGTTPGSPVISLPTGLAPGQYYGMAAITSTQAVNYTDVVPVLYTVLAPPPCTYTLNPSSITVQAGGGNGSFTVSTGPTCPWSVNIPAASGVTVTNTPPPAGPGTVQFSVANYTQPTQRAIALTAGGQTFTANQFGLSCSFTLDPATFNIPATGGGATINVRASSPSCAWPASSGLGVVTPANATGNDQATVTIPVNTGANAQTLTSTIAGQTLTVIQGGAACNVTLGAGSASFDANGGQGSIAVNAVPGCTYSTNPGPGWISIDSGSAGTIPAAGQSTITFSIAPNSTTVNRNGGLQISGQPFQITQQGLTCSISIDTSQLPNPFNVSGGPGTVGITTNGPNCGWTAISNTTFATVSPPGGNGNGTVTVNPSSNAASTTSRSGSVSISGQTVTYNQAGTTCTFNLRSSSGTSPAGGGLGSVSVVSPSACTWAATSNDPAFLSINNGAVSGGTAEVQFIVAANTNANPRSGTLTVAGNTFRVNQAGAPCSFTLGAASATMPIANTGVVGATVAVTTAQTGCTLNALSYANWITLNTTFSGTSGTVTYTAAANTTGGARSGNIQIGDQVYSVTEAGANCSFSLNAYGAFYNRLGGSSAVLGSPNANTCLAPTVGTTLPWVTLGALSGLPNNIYSQNYLVNPFNSASKATRRSSITFGGQIFTIKQTSY